MNIYTANETLFERELTISVYGQQGLFFIFRKMTKRFRKLDFR